MCKPVNVVVHARCKYYTLFKELQFNNHISIKQLYNKAITHYDLNSIYTYPSRVVYILTKIQRVGRFIYRFTHFIKSKISKDRVVVTHPTHDLSPFEAYGDSRNNPFSDLSISYSVPRISTTRWTINAKLLSGTLLPGSPFDALALYPVWGSLYRVGSLGDFWVIGDDYE
jgi:hypothetical protein